MKADQFPASLMHLQHRHVSEVVSIESYKILAQSLAPFRMSILFYDQQSHDAPRY